jgi:flagellar motor switch/type III secretory pathway protein FliN
MAETMVATDEKTEGQQTMTTDTEQGLSGTGVQSVEFPEVEAGGAAGAGTSIDILLDMEVPVTVVIGRAEIPIQQLLQLGPGAVLKLANTVDTPAELYLKDTKFAYDRDQAFGQTREKLNRCGDRLRWESF